MEQEKLDRINELGRLSRQRPLTEAEREEQAVLRAAYLAEFRAGLHGTLEHTYVERPDGSRTPLSDHKTQHG